MFGFDSQPCQFALGAELGFSQLVFLQKNCPSILLELVPEGWLGRSSDRAVTFLPDGGTGEPNTRRTPLSCVPRGCTRHVRVPASPLLLLVASRRPFCCGAGDWRQGRAVFKCTRALGTMRRLGVDAELLLTRGNSSRAARGIRAALC